MSCFMHRPSIRDQFLLAIVVYIGKHSVKAFFLLWGSRNLLLKGRPVCVPVVAGKLAWQKGECQGETKKHKH